jgi:anti-anti-sigma regulatory factor
VVKVEADPARRLMVVRYGGHITPAEAQKALLDAPAALAQLKKGFRLLVDLTELEKMDLACAPVIEKIMDLCQAKGVADVVRVIPDPTRDIGMGIMSHFHYDSGVRIATCPTLDDALRILAVNAAAE